MMVNSDPCTAWISGNALSPLKTKFFAWLVTHDKILSRENLAKKDWLGSIVCVFCGCEVESTRHIFLQCLAIGGV